MRAAKDLGIQQLVVFGDSELVVQQVRNVSQVKQQVLKVYRNEVWDLMDNFFSAFNISFIPRDQNHTTDSLALAATFFKVPQKLSSGIQLKLGIRLLFLITSNIGECFRMIWRLRNSWN